MRANPDVIKKAMLIIDDNLNSDTKYDKLALCQACMGVAKVMLEDTGHQTLANTINTMGMLINDDLEASK
jgi:hypothetical protein